MGFDTESGTEVPPKLGQTLEGSLFIIHYSTNQFASFASMHGRALREVRAPISGPLSLGRNRSDKLDRARSRLYRSRFLQVNANLKVVAEIYKIHSFALL